MNTVKQNGIWGDIADELDENFGVNLTAYMKSMFGMLPTRPVAHAHLTTPLAGIILSDAWLKLAIDETSFTVDAEGGFTFTLGTNDFTWDAANTFAFPLPITFIGDAGVQVTSTVSAPVTITFGLFVNDVVVLETPLTFTSKDKIQGYGGNEKIIIPQGHKIDVRVKAGVAETPTVSLSYFNITTEGR